MAQQPDDLQRVALRPAQPRHRGKLGTPGQPCVAAPARPPTRILVASHGHPAITRGGAEIAAYALFQALRADPAYEAWFLGCRPAAGGHRLGVTITQPFGEREFVYSPAAFDWFKFANHDPAFPAEFRRLLEELRPDIVHFHHFAIFGLEAFRIVKDTLPQCRIILTAHEYLLICNAYGQMVTKQDQHLCFRATLDDCHGCFPQHSRADFFLRRHWADLFLPFVDTFIAPSRFLASRLVAWGIDASRLHVVDNLVPPQAATALSSSVPPAGPLRVGFFGQISRLKGIGVLLEAAAMLERDPGDAISIDIHGEYRGQPPEFQAEFLQQLSHAGANVRYHGAYRPDQVDRLMAGVAVVVVPSIWWENSPLVIQEALRNRRPVLCSDIGGMAEKVADGVDGWHVLVGSAMELAARLRALAADRDQVVAMSRTIRPHGSPHAILDAHTRLYQQGAIVAPAD